MFFCRIDGSRGQHSFSLKADWILYYCITVLFAFYNNNNSGRTRVYFSPNNVTRNDFSQNKYLKKNLNASKPSN